MKIKVALEMEVYVHKWLLLQIVASLSLGIY
jgi:hypothetical protein